ncbi:MAG: transposase [Ignavibacteriales bacterium]
MREWRLACNFAGNQSRSPFFDDDDSLRFLETLEQKKRNQEYELYGYCLMNNHVHLLVRENKDTVSRTMSRIGPS